MMYMLCTGWVGTSFECCYNSIYRGYEMSYPFIRPCIKGPHNSMYTIVGAHLVRILDNFDHILLSWIGTLKRENVPLFETPTVFKDKWPRFLRERFSFNNFALTIFASNLPLAARVPEVLLVSRHTANLSQILVSECGSFQRSRDPLCRSGSPMCCSSIPPIWWGQPHDCSGVGPMIKKNHALP